MSNDTKCFAEKTFQENFVNELKKYSWDAPDELNGNLQHVTVETLINNWRRELNRLNAEILEGVDLTDTEFRQVLSKVRRINNSYDAAKLLAVENGKGKIEGISRDDRLNVKRKNITLTIFRRAQVLGGDSTYQIAREVTTNKGNRFDIVLLLCGLPLINIEQKRADKNLDEAFGQFLRYYKDGEYSNNFMAFSQMMVITSEISTEYFATPKSAAAFNRAFCFHWTDQNNRIINDWREITATLLKIPMAHQMVGDYLVINHSTDPSECYHMLMRPYQVYALQAIELAAKGMDNDARLPHGGYVWHTTGSGKTVTSFKTALFLATKGGFDKVVFLVDRRELDKNTVKSFLSYAEYEGKNKVFPTKTTRSLRNHLNNNKGIIITTTFKLHSLVKELEESHDESLNNMKIIFIIDEAHRTTMGFMMKTIMEFFHKQGLFFGFTGTPLFDKNKIHGLIADDATYIRYKRLLELTDKFLDDSADGSRELQNGKLVVNTTEKLFGLPLHEYKIDEAIRDRNVLGFHIDYLNTGEFESYDSLREKLFEELKEETPDKPDKEIRRELLKLTEEQLELESKKRGIVLYQDETHIPRVVQTILKDWDFQSQDRMFNAILTTGRISRAIQYWQEFQKQQQDSPHPLNVAVTFSFGNENDQDNIAVKEAQAIFDSYRQITELEFKLHGSKNGAKEYFEDLIERAQKGGSGRDPKNVDLVIVADQLLTGYDSRYLNTLYVDQNLKLQGLVQAYSRTNRIYGKEKEFGTVINFMWPKLTEASVDAALILYGSGQKSDRSPAIVDTYDIAVIKLAACVDSMVKTLKEPSAWATLENDEEQKVAFINAYKETSAQMNKVHQYYEYEWHSDHFKLDEHTWKQYIGAYRNLTGETIIPPLSPRAIRDLQTGTNLVGYQEITSQFILQRIGERAHLDRQEAPLDQESLRLILEQIEELSSMGQAILASTIRQFVEEIQIGKVQLTSDMEKLFHEWTQANLRSEIAKFCEEWKIDADIVYKAFLAYDVLKDGHNIPRVNEIIDSVNMDHIDDAFDHNYKLMSILPDWFKNLKNKYMF